MFLYPEFWNYELNLLGLFLNVHIFCVKFSGEVAWRLHDTYGFPIDLTALMAEERKMTVDMEGYEKAKIHAQVRYFNKLYCNPWEIIHFS